VNSKSSLTVVTRDILSRARGVFSRQSCRDAALVGDVLGL
jgi:hypothetical protein